MKTPCALIGLLVFALSLGSANAIIAVLYSHHGSLDPLADEGWGYNNNPSDIVGPVINDLGTGLDAWMVNDPSGSDGGPYHNSFTPSDLSLIDDNPWIMTANLRVVEGFETLSGNTHNSNKMAIILDGLEFYIEFGMRADNDEPIMFVNQGGPFVDDYIPVPVGMGANSYVTYQMRFDPSDSLVDIFIKDGVNPTAEFELLYGDYAGFPVASTNDGLRFGGGSTTGTGHANWNLFEFKVVPEPSRLVLMLAGLGMVFASRRKRG